jgi:hypothetical protein
MGACPHDVLRPGGARRPGRGRQPGRVDLPEITDEEASHAEDDVRVLVQAMATVSVTVVNGAIPAVHWFAMAGLFEYGISLVTGSRSLCTAGQSRGSHG